MKHRIFFAGALAAMSAALLPVYADNPQYRRSLSCSDGGITATCEGRISGLGNGDVQIILRFPNATATTSCLAPGSGNPSPGQNPGANVSVTGTQTYDNPKNGNLTFTVTTVPPATPTWDQAGCQNQNWGTALEGVSFGSGTLSIYQLDANGTPVLVLGPTSVTL